MAHVPGLELPEPPVDAAPRVVSAEAAAAHVSPVKDHTLRHVSVTSLPLPQPPDDHVAVPAGHVGQPVHPPPPVHSLAPGPTIPDNTRIINNKHTVELFKVDKKLRRNTFNMNIYCPCLNLNVV